MLLALAVIFLAAWLWEVTGSTAPPPTWVHLFLPAGASAFLLYICVPRTRASQIFSDEARRGRRDVYRQHSLSLERSEGGRACPRPRF